MRSLAIREQLLSGNPADSNYASQFVERLLTAAREAGASDVHLQPTENDLHVSWRLDGVLVPLGNFPTGVAANVVARLKVLANLLTYRTETPQEGRIRAAAGDVEMRVSTFPTLFGERAVVRIFAQHDRRLDRLADLGFPEEVVQLLQRQLAETSGAILVTGPAGSGKTTTLYAAVREVQSASSESRSILTIEDPIETVVSGVSQSQVNDAAGFDLATGLRSLVRQDPEVILVGEIRDRATAEITFQAALTGHLVLTTFHAGSSAGALGRLADMEIEPYVLRSGILAVIAQRLVRKLCTCSQSVENEAELLGLKVASARVPVGCDACLGAGYRGRLLLAEMCTLSSGPVTAAVLARRETQELQAAAEEAGMVSLAERARLAVEHGQTSPAEVRRVLGFS